MFKYSRYAPAHALALLLCVAAGAAQAQAPRAQEEPATPSAPAPSKPAPADPAQAQKPDDKEKPDESSALRIRGIVDVADDKGVMVQLSKGISIRVNIEPGTPVFSATRISASDLKKGANIGVRTRNPAVAGENTAAVEVVALEPAAAERLTELSVKGALKTMDKSGENQVLVVTESGGADRRLAIGKETTFWRIQPAALKDVKPGVLVSVLIVRDSSGDASAQRAVFGSAPPGGMLPL